MQGYLIPPLIIDIVIKVIFGEAKKKKKIEHILIAKDGSSRWHNLIYKQTEPPK